MPNTPPLARPRPWSKRELLTYLDRVLPALAGLNHFELLDVAPGASPAQIQAAFHAMAAGLHPDRHRNALSPEQYEKLIVVYAKIAEAYRVLRSPDNKDAYLQREARERSSASGPGSNAEFGLALLSPKAQTLYRRGMAALGTGDDASATLNLRMALAKHPQSVFLKQALQRLKKRD